MEEAYGISQGGPPAPSFFLFFFNLSAVLPGMLDLSSPTRDGTQPPCIENSLSHWTPREVSRLTLCAHMHAQSCPAL